MDDGDIDVGYRWLDQLPGPRFGAKGDWYNRNSIGICLVGTDAGAGYGPAGAAVANWCRN